MRSVRSEMLYALEALAIPLAVAFAFPYGSVSWSARDDEPPADCSSAFVQLDRTAADKALIATRGTWKDGADDIRHLRPDLFFGELPESETELIFPAGTAVVSPELTLVPRGQTPFLPSRRAAPPKPLPQADPPRAPLAFSREELLKID